MDVFHQPAEVEDKTGVSKSTDTGAVHCGLAGVRGAHPRHVALRLSCSEHAAEGGLCSLFGDGVGSVTAGTGLEAGGPADGQGGLGDVGCRKPGMDVLRELAASRSPATVDYPRVVRHGGSFLRDRAVSRQRPRLAAL